MVKFVIVDDDENEIKHITALLNDVIIDKEIISFSKITNELKEEINNLDERKVYILDIDLGTKISGISIAKMIRDKDFLSEIIFITNHEKMFESAHRNVYSVFVFLEKFHEFDRRFKKAIREILKNNFDNMMFSYKLNNVELNLFYKNILYIYRDTEERKLILVTDTNTYKVSLSIKEILGSLDDRFRQCHRSCIFNKYRVQEKNYKDKYFVLDNGMKVYMLSKKYKKEIEK